MANTTDKTVTSKYQPKSTNVIWIDISGDKPVEKHFINGRWMAIGGSTPTYEGKEGQMMVSDGEGGIVAAKHTYVDDKDRIVLKGAIIDGNVNIKGGLNTEMLVIDGRVIVMRDADDKYVLLMIKNKQIVIEPIDD